MTALLGRHVGRRPVPRGRRGSSCAGSCRASGSGRSCTPRRPGWRSTGRVRNESGGVVVEVEGAGRAVARVRRRLLRASAPPLALVERRRGRSSCRRRAAPASPSTAPGARPGGRTLAAPDVATCDDCLRELADPADRRYRHPFISCTNCGPRFTIITDLPYDRPATTMAGFPMCAGLRRASTPTRPTGASTPSRSPARPAARGWRFVGADGATADRRGRAGRGARALLAAGGDRRGQGAGRLPPGLRRHATSARSRRCGARKRRGDKPFAVMVARPRRRPRARRGRRRRRGGAAHRPARGPIVLLPPPGGGAARAGRWRPGNPDLGVLLPYTPLHHLLLGLPGEPGVGTAGDDLGQPRRRADRVRRRRRPVRLAPLVDGWLRHDRPIARAVRRLGGPGGRRRRAAAAPLPRLRPAAGAAAVRRSRRPWPSGADLKNTCCARLAAATRG